MVRADVIFRDVAKEEHANRMWGKETIHFIQATVLKDNVMSTSDPSWSTLNAGIIFILLNMIKLSGY